MSIKNKLKTLFAMDDDYEYEYVEEVEESETKLKPLTNNNTTTNNVINLKSVKTASSKVVLCEPRTYEEAQQIADNIVNKRAVVINLQRVETNEAKRIVDFLSGTVYAVNGVIQRLGSQTFLCAPDNVDVSGNISESYED
ncbi:cell division protein SepF [Ornithinibacillus halotolerans]|uniref:Cell division protein SepF n=1 Tax=Ornithinibacillus halotolerans TaxID=1274357 RepID=A0A916S4P6_9BACI|nr:cell division protein SepF [Ornithinibacillus halotolerans]GGA84010.1 cell division protein SepF [Ornithinibacillus halotolerans]